MAAGLVPAHNVFQRRLRDNKVAGLPPLCWGQTATFRIVLSYGVATISRRSGHQV